MGGSRLVGSAQFDGLGEEGKSELRWNRTPFRLKGFPPTPLDTEILCEIGAELHQYIEDLAPGFAIAEAGGDAGDCQNFCVRGD